MAQYLVKVTDTYRTNGEYGGGRTLAEARRTAREFAEEPRLANATIRIVKVVRGDQIKTVEYVREHNWREPYSDSGDNPISTGAKVAIGAGIIGILAAIFWPKKKTDAAPTGKPTANLPPPDTKGTELYWIGLWLWEDGGWSLVQQKGPYSYPFAGAPVFAWPMFDPQITKPPPPYYYAGGYRWNGSSWSLQAEACNGQWCGQ